jgi:hypothetical protein
VFNIHEEELARLQVNGSNLLWYYHKVKLNFHYQQKENAIKLLTLNAVSASFMKYIMCQKFPSSPDDFCMQ